ncbi:MAG: hypothetical protein V4490_05540, partial [Pseudomonadota bacterium]
RTLSGCAVYGNYISFDRLPEFNVPEDLIRNEAPFPIYSKIDDKNFLCSLQEIIPSGPKTQDTYAAHNDIMLFVFSHSKPKSQAAIRVALCRLQEIILKHYQNPQLFFFAMDEKIKSNLMVCHEGAARNRASSRLPTFTDIPQIRKFLTSLKAIHYLNRLENFDLKAKESGAVYTNTQFLNHMELIATNSNSSDIMNRFRALYKEWRA